MNATSENARRQPGAAFETAQEGTGRAHYTAAKRCPFGTEIEAKLKATGTTDVRLYAGRGDRWRSAMRRRALVGPATATLLPPGDDPLALRWPACPIVGDVSGLDGATVRKLASALVRDGAQLAFLTDLKSGITHRIVPVTKVA